MRKLNNILINTRENKLRFAEVHFTNKIKEIKFLSDEFNWNEIDSPDKIKKIKENFPSDASDKNIIDGKFNLLIPGAIDPHVHFDTPGFEFRDDFEHGSTAAAFGGVTTVIDMPCTSLPPVTDLKNFNTKLAAIENRSLVDFAFWGGVRGNDFKDKVNIERQVKELAEAGVTSFKVYVISGMDTFTDLTYEQIKTAAGYIKQTGKPMGVHSEDKKLIVEKRKEFQSKNKNNYKDYCAARSVEAEVKAIENIIEITKETGSRTLIVHLSSAKGLEKIIEAKNKGIDISAETCPQYLFFTQKDFENEKISAFLKTAPPVKKKIDKEKLWKGLSENKIEFVSTDHAGCNPEVDKTTDNFWEVYGGIPGVEHRVPFLFSEGFLKNKITLERTIKLLSTNAAEFYNLKSKGILIEGYDADFALINLWDKQIVKSEEMHSKGKYTPFDGTAFNAVVNKTILRGKIIMDKDNPAEEEIGYGEFIKAGTQ